MRALDFHSNFKNLQKVIDIEEIKKRKNFKMRAEGYMDLTIEYREKTNNGFIFSLCHSYIQNGDLMSDPYMVFRVYENDKYPTVEPLSFQQDGVPGGTLYQEVYQYDSTGDIVGFLPGLQQDLNSFAKTWFKNLREQGHTIESDSHNKKINV